ncbi:MAG: sugar ABC transporter substrate-binding protein [Chloroflexi bacterium]|nr:sugar ABC transporter substrate-binding protein [Chloroflexota bacterium]
MYKHWQDSRLFSLLGLLLASLFVLSACTPIAPPPAGQSAAEPAAEASVAMPVELRLASYGLGDAWNSNLEKTIDGFREANPNITVKVEFRPIDAYWDKLQTEFAAGTAPDITINQMDWVIPGAARGMFTDLIPFVDRDQVDMDAYFYDMQPEWGWKGGLYGGLLYAGGQALYINKDLLAAAGLEMPSADWTWNDLLEYATKLTNAETGQWGVYISPLNPPYWGASFVHGAGGSVLDESKTSCALTGAEAQAGLQFLSDLISMHKVMPAPVTLQGQENPFLTGKVAMLFGGTWQEGQIREAGFDWDFAHMPAHPDTGARNVQMGSNAWSILSSSEHQDEAWLLVNYLMGEGGQRGMMTNGVPGLTDVVNSQDYLNLHQPQDISVVTGDFANYGHDYYPTPDTGEWWNAVGQELSAIWSGEATVEEATTRACAAVDEIFARRPAEWNQ